MNWPEFNSLNVIFQWVLLTLASYRLTRIIVADSLPLSKAFRNYVNYRTGKDSAWSDLVSCSWCAGTYVTTAVFVLASFSFNVPLPVLQAVATMTVIGFLGNHDD